MADKKIIVTQTRSSIRRHRSQEATLRALGLGRIGRTVEHRSSPEIMGMIRKVAHLVQIGEPGN